MSQSFQFAPATTAVKNAITTPQQGVLLYDATLNKLSPYNGSSWDIMPSFVSGTASAVANFTIPVDLVNYNYVEIMLRMTNSSSAVNIGISYKDSLNNIAAFSEFQQTLTKANSTTSSGTSGLISLNSESESNQTMGSGTIILTKALGSSLRAGMYGQFNYCYATIGQSRNVFSGYYYNAGNALAGVYISVGVGTLSAQYSVNSYI